jgi:hypothetical protein
MPFASQLSVLPPHYLEALLRFDLRTSP